MNSIRFINHSSIFTGKLLTMVRKIKVIIFLNIFSLIFVDGFCPNLSITLQTIKFVT